MTMGFGMIGALGGFGNGTGLGGAMMNEAAIMQKDEERTKGIADQKAMEEWRLKTAEGYKIAAERRAVTQKIEDDERNWQNEQARAPKKAEIAASASTTAKKAELDFTTQNIDTITSNTRKTKEAGETDSERELRNAQASYYRDRGDAVSQPKGSAKLDPLLKEQLDSLDKEIEKKQGLIDQARATGSWTTMKDKDGKDVSGTPEQRAMQAEVAALKLRRAALYASAPKSGDAPAQADPLGVRSPRKAAGGTAAQPGDADREAILRQEFTKAQGYLANAKTDDDRQRAQNDLNSLRREAQRAGFNIDEPGASGMVRTPAPAAPPRAATSQPSVTTPSAPAGLPRTLGEVPGAVTPTTRVARGTDLGDGDFTAKVARLRQGAGATSATPPDGAVKEALGAGGSSSIDQIVGERAPALMKAADELKAAQQQVATAAKSQQQDAVTRAVASAAAAGSRLDALLKDMMPAQQKKVREALGV